eukprot:7384443-Prymnesium_polylepis.1
MSTGWPGHRTSRQRTADFQNPRICRESANPLRSFATMRRERTATPLRTCAIPPLSAYRQNYICYGEHCTHR